MIVCYWMTQRVITGNEIIRTLFYLILVYFSERQPSDVTESRARSFLPMTPLTSAVPKQDMRSKSKRDFWLWSDPPSVIRRHGSFWNCYNWKFSSVSQLSSLSVVWRSLNSCSSQSSSDQFAPSSISPWHARPLWPVCPWNAQCLPVYASLSHEHPWNVLTSHNLNSQVHAPFRLCAD